MRVGIVISDLQHQFAHAEALSQGLAKHGITTRIYSESERRVPDESVCACWGWRIGKPLRALGKEVLVMERGFIERMKWTSLGWNGINGHATRRWRAIPYRLERFRGLPRPWVANGVYALLIGQVKGDAAVEGVDLDRWYAEAITGISRYGLPIMFRRHPVAVMHGQFDKPTGAQILENALAEAIEGAAVVVTFNSNTGVDSLLAGRPTIARDKGSMAYGIAASDWKMQDRPDRQAWAEMLASSQFSLEEIRSGYAWEIVKDSAPLQ